MRILTADDSKVVLHTMRAILAELGYHDVKQCANVEEAKNLLDGLDFDLIFSDWHMPGATGLDLLKHVRATPRLAKIPFVMVTTEHERQNILEAIRYGLQSFVFKPVTKSVLAQKLGELAKSHGIQAPSGNPQPQTPAAAQPQAAPEPQPAAAPAQ